MEPVRLRRCTPASIGLVGAFTILMTSILLLSSASSAHAAYQRFCWGVTVAGNNSGQESICDSLYHDGIAGYIDEVSGSGAQHSVCVEAWWGEGTEMCSGGPNQGVYNASPTGHIKSVGQIRNNAAGNNTVYASLGTCANPCDGSGGGGGGPSWHTDNLGGNSTSDSDIASWSSGHLDVFTRGTNNVLCHKSWDPTYGWSSWDQLPGPTITSSPASVSWGPGRIDVVARIADGSVEHWGYESGVWSYENLGGNVTADPDISSWSSGRLDVFARGTDNGLYHKSWAGNWSAWEKIPGPTIASGPGAVSWGPNRIDVVAEVTGGTVQHWSWSPTFGWNNENLGGNITADPDISSWESGRLDVFARGTDNGLYHKSWTGAWSAWEGVGGPALSSGPGAVSWGPGRIDVVARAADNTVTHWYWSP